MEEFSDRQLWYRRANQKKKKHKQYRANLKYRKKNNAAKFPISFGDRNCTINLEKERDFTDFEVPELKLDRQVDNAVVDLPVDNPEVNKREVLLEQKITAVIEDQIIKVDERKVLLEQKIADAGTENSKRPLDSKSVNLSRVNNNSSTVNKKKKNKYQKPPLHLRHRNCYRPSYTDDWIPLDKDNERVDLQEGKAWFMFLPKFYEKKEKKQMREEDEKKLKLRQELIFNFGHYGPIRHLTGLVATSDVEAMVSDYGTKDEAQDGFFVSQNIQDFPVQQQLLDKWNQHLRTLNSKDATKLNSREVVCYRGKTDSQDSLETLDHCSFHNGDGNCVEEGSTIVTGCIGTVNTVFRIIRNTSKLEDTGEQYWLVNSPNTGYIIGGKDFHKLYTHGKFFLTTSVKPTDWAISNVYRHSRSFYIQSTNPFHQSRGEIVNFSSNSVPSSHIWTRTFKPGSISKAITPDCILKANSTFIKQRNNSTLCWEPGDMFKNVGILQVTNLHPNPGGAGIAGSTIAVSILLSNSYSNHVTIKGYQIEITYKYPTTSDTGKDQLIQSQRENNIIRVFVKSDSPFRCLFSEPIDWDIYLCNAIIHQHNEIDNSFTFIGLIDKNMLNK